MGDFFCLLSSFNIVKLSLMSIYVLILKQKNFKDTFLDVLNWVEVQVYEM